MERYNIKFCIYGDYAVLMPPTEKMYAFAADTKKATFSSKLE